MSEDREIPIPGMEDPNAVSRDDGSGASGASADGRYGRHAAGASGSDSSRVNVDDVESWLRSARDQEFGEVM